MFRVICDFLDLEDNSFLYTVGKEYPRKGYSPSKERISELSGSKNKMGRPLIEKEDKAVKKTVKKKVTKKTEK